MGRPIGLWATFQSLWQQLFCPNLPHSQAIFVKVSKSITFLVKSILGNFYRQLVCPNLLYSYSIFVKVSKSLICLVKSFWATFIDIWQLFTSHTAYLGQEFQYVVLQIINSLPVSIISESTVTKGCATHGFDSSFIY